MPTPSFMWSLRMCAVVFFVASAHAVDFSNGVLTAVPVKAGQAPKIDGDLSDWDLSHQEPVYISAQTAEAMNAEWAFMYDDGALYVSARVSMPGRAYENSYNPQDAFWSGDILQARIAVDPSLPYPLESVRDKANDRVAHLSFWKNQQTGQNFLHINRGTRLNLGQVVNPEGSAIRIVTEGTSGYVMEARIPWAALNVPGGKNPFVAGASAAFTAETLWIGGDKARVILGYRTNPGVFAFHRPDCWGRLVFAASSPDKRVRPTLAEVMAQARAEAGAEPVSVGVPFVVEVPGDGLKVSVNILGPAGEVVREVIAAEPRAKGSLTVRWDGRDAWGRALAPGSYTWGAYFHKPIVADYQGGVGSSGHPYYKTLDNKGSWGGDHSNPIDVVAQRDAFYLLWPVAEAGQALVKTDLKGKVIWRSNPFVGGGFGPFHAVAVEGRQVFLARNADNFEKKQTTTHLVKLSVEHGALSTWGEGGPVEMPVFTADHKLIPSDSTPLPLGALKNQPDYAKGQARQPECAGMVASGGKVFMSSFSLNKIFVVSAETGKVTGELNVPGPRGLALDGEGDLYAVSFVPDRLAQVVRFHGAAGSPETVIDSGLNAPFDLAVMRDGGLAVTDGGSSQQVKCFDSKGKPRVALGKKGGRPWQGAYDSAELNFLNPAGIAVDAEGALIVAESSPPKIFSRIDAGTGRLLDRWYGPGVYWNATWPMPDDPRNVFYILTHAIGRARVAGPDAVAAPNAYWDPNSAGYEQVGDMEDSIPQPEVVAATNGKTYFVKDTFEHAILIMENDVMRPVATWTGVYAHEKTNALKRPYLKVWIDRNGDGHVQAEENSELMNLPDGKPMPSLSKTTSSMHMTANGDLYFATQENVILKIPAVGFDKGMIRWDLTRAHFAVPEILPGADRLPSGYREGVVGMRLDTKGNLYTLYNARLKGGTGSFDWPDEATATRMLEGMGHTSRTNAVKFAKFSPQGKLLWMAGRKATAGARPGEMYHFWNMAGIVNDRYIAGASEWGQIYLYTHDGFFVDALMNNPADVLPPGPYTFGGETSGGRVAYFPKTGELWAYSSGMTYKVNGFSQGVVENESRARGTVVLDRIYELAGQTVDAAEPIRIIPLSGSPLSDAKVWDSAPISLLKRSDRPLARARLGYDQRYLYARIEVTDDSPLQNGATEDQLVFKAGDTAGFVLGPVRDAVTDAPGLGDVRFMAVKIKGRPAVVAMKAVSRGAKKPFEYYTPAAGTHVFDFVGEVPDAKVEFTTTANGYVATFAVPRTFLEFNLDAGTQLRGDVEVRLSGAGARGLQAVSRNYLFTPATSETTMTDDVPTEARLYPKYWGAIEVK